MATSIIPVNLGFVKSFLVVGDRVVVVDAGLRGSVKRILKALGRHCIRYDEVSLILVTHAHADHTGGLKGMKDMLNAPVAVHRLEADCLTDGSGAPAVMRSRMMKLLSALFHEKAAGVKPDVIVDDRLDLAPYGVDGYVMHTPGHTAGSVSLVTNDGNVLVGDMAGGYLRPALPGVYADLTILKKSIGLLKRTNAQNVYTSHGGAHSLGDVLILSK